MNTSLQEGFGHVYESDIELQTDGTFPVWLEQNGSRIFGGIIDLQYEYVTGIKIADLYPEAIRTATPCYALRNKKYIPIPTFRVVEDVSAEDTEVVLANWWGCAKPITGITLSLYGNDTAEIALTDANLVEDNTNRTYKLTITANQFGELKAGDCFILKQVADKVVLGLTKDNLQGYNSTSKLNIVLCDTGRVIEASAPSLPGGMKEKIQTIKYEED